MLYHKVTFRSSIDLPRPPRHGPAGASRRRWWCLLLLPFLGVAASQAPAEGVVKNPPHAATASTGEPVDDRAIQARLNEAGAQMVAAGRTTRMSSLIAQLSRRQCQLDLPKPEGAERSAPKLASDCRAAVVIVARVMRGPSANLWAAVPASGFFISSSGAFVTSYHVVNSPESETIVVMTPEGQVFPVRSVLAADPACDVAILQAECAGVAVLPLAASGAEVGAKVCVVSHPVGRFYTFTEGSISRISLAREGGGARKVLEISADFGPGSSGAPVVSTAGSVVGWVDTLAVRPFLEGREDAASPRMVFRECGIVADLLRLIANKP